MPSAEERGSLSRGDFLRWAALGTGGLGLTALAGCSSKTVIHEAERAGYVVAVTHSGADANRAMLALFTATKLPAGDNHVWFAIEGGQLCKKEEAERFTAPMFTKQGPAAKLLDQLRAKGTGLHI